MLFSSSRLSSWLTLMLLALLGLLGTNCGGGGSADGGRPGAAGQASGLGSLTVTLPNPGLTGAARLSGTLAGGAQEIVLAAPTPSPSPFTAWYQVELQDPQERTLSELRLEPLPGQSTVSGTFRNLVPGPYIVCIEAFDSTGRNVGEGTSAVEIVAAQATSVSISVTPVSSPSPSPTTTPTAYTYSYGWGTSGVPGDSSTQFRFPHGIVVNPANGHVYVSDTDNRKIKEYLADGTWVSTYTGLTMARSIAIRNMGNVVFGDNIPSSPSNIYQVAEYAPATNTEVARFGGPQGSGDGQFSTIWAVATSRTQDRIYVADYFNNRVQAFNLVSGSWTFDTKWGSAGTGAGQFNHPEGITTDQAGNVYVADSANDRLQKFSPSGVHLATFGASGTGPGQFRGPNGLCVDDQGCIYVAEFTNNRIQKLAPDGSFLCYVQGATPPGQTNQAYALAWYQGRVYVADTYNHRVAVFVPLP